MELLRTTGVTLELFDHTGRNTVLHLEVFLALAAS
jgi:hypothetical protein